MSDPCPLPWSGLLFDRSGCAEEARNAILALDAAGIDIRANPLLEGPWQVKIPRSLTQQLERLISTRVPVRFVHVIHHCPSSFRRHPRALLNVGRTMFETDSLPPEWVARCNQMDELWVPSDFNIETFARAGIARDKLHKVPETLRSELYNPSLSPSPLQGLSSFVFLSVFGWGRRKGWDVLVRAYLEEFRPTEDVTLLLKISPSFGLTVNDHCQELRAFIREQLGHDLKRGPRIIVLDDDPGMAGMPRLYRTADAFVMPSRGEGWGRPYMEAMAMGLPTIGTRWSGNLEFMTDENSYLVDCTVVEVPEIGWREWPIFGGHRWAEPDVEHLRRLMRGVFENPDKAADRGARARQDILEHYSWGRLADAIIGRLHADMVNPARARPTKSLQQHPQADAAAPLSVIWEGPQFINFGMAVVNRELCRELASSPGVEVSINPDKFTRSDASAEPSSAPLLGYANRHPSGTPPVHVRHAWPPCFQPPAAGRWVMMQPWEFGSLPRGWIEPMNRLVDEIWVPTTYVRDCYVRSGVDPSKVVVVPYGIDPARFHPDVLPLPLPTNKTFKYLFAGGTVTRKGADLLLATYLETFRPDDDVCLVIKDLGADSFYQGQGLGGRSGGYNPTPRTPRFFTLTMSCLSMTCRVSIELASVSSIPTAGRVSDCRLRKPWPVACQ